MKVYDPDAKTRANGSSAPPIDDDEQDPIREEEEFEFTTLFDAPSYSDFIKTKPNSRAQAYERRWASMMKAGLIGSINNEQWADAATFLKYGPGFAKAAGNLAAEDARMQQLTEMLTAPESPYVIFAMVTMPFIGQLFRNHQEDIAEARESRRARRAQRKAGNTSKVKVQPIVVHLGKRNVTVPFSRLFRVIKLPSLGKMFQGFLAPTQRPEAIQAEVFGDPAVRQALHKMGIFPVRSRDENAA